MLYSRKNMQDQLCFLEIGLDFITKDGVECVFTDGNIASKGTQSWFSFGENGEFLKKALDWNVLRAPYWPDYPDGSRKRSAEFLIHPRIPPDQILRISTASESGLEKAAEYGATATSKPSCKFSPERFFERQ